MQTTLTVRMKQHRDHLKQHKDIIFFMLSIAAIHFLWKLGSNANADDSEILFYGIDFTAFFDVINVTWTKSVLAFIRLFEGDNIAMNQNLLTFQDTNNMVRIVWGCSGIKELIMAVVMLLTAQGKLTQKAWYIPLSVAIIILINYVRLVILCYAVQHSYELFDILHRYIGRIMMYGGLIALWYIWMEKIQINNKLKLTTTPIK